VLIELFARCYGWAVDSKFQVEGVAPPQPFFFSEN